ncbi:hypothetical protein [Thermaerobacillus caldiproteolyticus]|uniref:hypothetical protein n=1 Tax=Thermaerobacillus caldiproteolyticus TaxID=247480 RepID=UPI00188A9430|nr:hypothetical protein [Anoxybacillus caldiproteolyticus]QPA30772.1 hypothetical protein ISX45_14545 [Anoxybacillus caldiproteolyticus]
MRDETKIHPMVLLSTFINVIVMAMFAYDKFSEKQMGYSIAFILLSLLFLGMTIYGLARNNKIGRTEK